MSTHTLTPRRLKLHRSPDADPDIITPDQLLHQVPACRDAEEGTCPSHAVPLAGEDAGTCLSTPSHRSLVTALGSRGLRRFHANLSPCTVSTPPHTNLAHCRLSMMFCCAVYKRTLCKVDRHASKPVTHSSGIQAIHRRPLFSDGEQKMYAPRSCHIHRPLRRRRSIQMTQSRALATRKTS